MTRAEFVAMACAMGVSPVHENGRREHVELLKGTVEQLADALGLEGPGASGREAQLEELVRERDMKILELQEADRRMREQIEPMARRIRELEEQLEQATAPAAQKGRRS